MIATRASPLIGKLPRGLRTVCLSLIVPCSADRTPLPPLRSKSLYAGGAVFDYNNLLNGRNCRQAATPPQ
jgi:hypothetical protein